MVRARLSQTTAILPLIFSALAFALVMANIVAGVPPQPDENASAHLWQVLMAGDVLLVVVFAATADWRSRQAPLVLGVQVLGIAIACLPVWLAGY
jgi:hypothetical protein